jgi:hypothetical protein
MIPPPHDPRERVLVARLGDWEVRAFAADDARADYLERNGFAHFQLWHPAARISVLTPSRLSEALYEVFPIRGWKQREPGWCRLRDLIAREHGVRLPPLAELRAIDRWFGRGFAGRRSAPQLPESCWQPLKPAG